MNLQQVGIVSVALGVVLLFLSFAWATIIPNEAVWSEEQAIAYRKASTKLHADLFDEKLSPEKLAESQANFKARRHQLDRAVAKKLVAPVYLRIAGLVAGGLGVALILVERGKA